MKERYVLFMENREGVQGYLHCTSGTPEIGDRASARVFDEREVAEQEAAKLLLDERLNVVRAVAVLLV